MDIIEVDDILQYRNGVPKSIYLGRLYKDGQSEIINHDNYHLSYNNQWFKFKDQEFIVNITSERLEDNTIKLIAIPEKKERFSNLIVKFYHGNDLIGRITINNDSESFQTLLNGLEGDTIDVIVETLPGVNRDQFWVYKPDKTQITI